MPAGTAVDRNTCRSWNRKRRHCPIITYESLCWCCFHHKKKITPALNKWRTPLKRFFSIMPLHAHRIPASGHWQLNSLSSTNRLQPLTTIQQKMFCWQSFSGKTAGWGLPSSARTPELLLCLYLRSAFWKICSPFIGRKNFPFSCINIKRGRKVARWKDAGLLTLLPYSGIPALNTLLFWPQERSWQ